MADPSSRLLRLIGLFTARPGWTAPELAERLAVTPRTVRRDVARLRDLGYPVDAESGPVGGYRLGRGAALPLLQLADDEAVAVAVGLRLAADGSIGGIDDATASALAKLDQVLPAPLAARVRGVHESVLDLRGRAPDRIAGAVFLDLARCCREGLRVRLHYVSRSGGSGERRVDPYRLVHAGPRWYLVGRDVDRDAWRTYRVDRIASVDPTRQGVEIIDPPDPEELVARGMGVAPYAVHARVRLRLDADAAASVLPRTVGVHEPEGPDATVVTVGGPDADRMAAWLCGLSAPVEVLSPEDLRSAVRRRAEHLAALNAGSS